MRKRLLPSMVGLVLGCPMFMTGVSFADEPALVNSVREIIDDMTLRHQGIPHGLPTGVDWRLKPRMGMGNNPGRFAAFTAWGQLYEDLEGNPATNTRVHIRNIRAYYLSKADNKWHLLQKSTGVEGAAYVEDFAGDVNKPAGIIKMKDGSLSVKAGGGYNFHFWPTTGRKGIKKDDIAGIFTTVQARLVLEDPNGPDDRDKAKYLLGMGADYWLSTTAAWDNFKTNGDVAIGRLKYVTKDWKAFNMCSVGQDVLASNPPPME